MSQSAEPLAAPARTTGKARWQRPPLWLWGALVALQVLCAALLTKGAFFFLDDYKFLGGARTDSFSLSYLRAGEYEHFSPISRAFMKLIVALAPGSFGLAHGVELALYACLLIAFALVVTTILGNSWSALVLTILFGQSVFLIRLLFFWTNVVNNVPAAIFSLLSIACYLRWRDGGSRRWLVGSFATFVVALLAYETAMLLPAYIALISLLVLEPRVSPRAWAASLWRERWAWAVYLTLDAAAIANYDAFYYQPTTLPSVGASAHFLTIALFETFLPATAGSYRPNLSPGNDPVALVAGLAVFALTTIVTIYFRPRAWRCLVAFIVVFLITMLPVGLNRVVYYGLGVGRVLFYQQAVQFMFFVLAALALSTRWDGRRAGRWRPPRRALQVGVVGALALYGALYVASLHALRNTTAQSSRDRAYVSAFLASVKRVSAASGRVPVLVDLAVPRAILPRGLRSSNTYGEFLGLFDPHLRINAIANPTYVVSPAGALEPVELAVSTSGPPACAPAGPSAAWLSLPLASVQRMSAETSALPYALRVRFTMPASSSVDMLLSSPEGHDFGTVTLRWRRGSGGELIPLNFSGELSELDFRLPARACVTSLAFGRLVYVPGS